jgi:arylsulfatase A-like enzyme
MSCELPREKRPSVLLIAVEGLGFNALNCDGEELGESSTEGLRVLCDEFVRFSHAYTPSTMSQAALASAVTGLYPFDHGVRHNGSDFLSARFRTAAELAVAKRYSTLFVSGGPPVWRKSGLAQGYEVFDDLVEINPIAPYRPAGDVIKQAQVWMEAQGDSRPFFVTLFLADLQFPFVATVADGTDAREKSVAGQVSEVMEAFNTLVKRLKRQKKWNSTNIALFGLNSAERSGGAQLPQPLNLKSGATQVAMFIKPARKEADNEIQWAVDRNVSVADLGHTVFTWLGEEAPVSSLPQLQPRSLASVLNKPEPDWGEERLILSESAWGDWLEGAGVRWALRQKQFLYIHDRSPLIYNTLTDKLENMPIRPSDPLWSSLSSDVMTLLRQSQVPPFRGMTAFWDEYLQEAKALWRDGQVRSGVRASDPWMKWYLERALRERQWRDLRRWAHLAGDPVGVYVASKQLNEAIAVPRNPCVRLLAAKNNKAYQSDCADEKILALAAWSAASGEEEKSIAMERFARLHSIERLDQSLGRLNYLQELTWDVDRNSPGAPSVADYLLTLKEFEPFKKLPSLRNSEDVSL